MIRLFWRTFISPQLRHPGLFLTGILGVAFCVSLFFSMGVASEKALRTISNDSSNLLSSTQHNSLPSYSLRKEQGRLAPSSLLACLRMAHLGFVCSGRIQLRVKDDKSQQDLTLLGRGGQWTTSLAPIFSADLQLELSIRGKPVRANSVTQRLQSTIVLDYRDITTLFTRDMGYDSIEIIPAGQLSYTPKLWQSHVEKFVASLARADEMILRPASEQVDERLQLTASYRLNLIILTATSILVAGLFLWNIAALQIHNRRRMLAIFRQIGIRRNQGLLLLIGEQIFVALVGSLLGLALGGYLEKLVSHLTLKTLNDLYLQSSLMPEVDAADNAVAAVIFGLVFYLLACARLTFKLLNVSPQDLRSQAVPVRSDRWTRVIVIFLALLSIPLGYFAPNFTLTFVSERAQPYLAYFAAFSVFVLAFACAPVANSLTRMIIRIIVTSDLLRRWPTFMIAGTRYIRLGQSGGTSIATVGSALTLSLGIALMVASFRTSVTDWFDYVFRAGVVVSGKEIVSQSKYPLILGSDVERIKAVSSVNAIDCMQRIDAEFRKLPVTAYGVDYSGPDNALTPLVFRGSYRPMQTLGQFRKEFSSDEIIVNEPLANRYQLSIDDRINLKIGERSIGSFRVIGIVQDYGSEGGYVLMPSQHIEAFGKIPGCHRLRVYSDGIDPSSLSAQIQELDAEQVSFEAMTTKKLRSYVVDTFNQTFAITDVMTFLAVILGGLALLVHVAQSTYDCKDEWLALRRVGLSWRALWKIALWDNIFILSCGVIIGMICGALLSWILVFLINVKSFGWSFQMSLATALSSGSRIVLIFYSLLMLLSALLTLKLIRPGERWQRWRE